jgi:hypothetical protein
MYQISVNEEQMRVIQDALDFYERVLGLGQLEEVENHWRWDANVKSDDFQSKSDSIRFSLYAAKAAGWNMSPNSSRGIRSPDVPKRFRVAYDMTQVLRKFSSDLRINRALREKDIEAAKFESITVSQNSFWATCEEVPPILVEWIEK